MSELLCHPDVCSQNRVFCHLKKSMAANPIGRVHTLPDFRALTSGYLFASTVNITTSISILPVASCKKEIFPSAICSMLLHSPGIDRGPRFTASDHAESILRAHRNPPHKPGFGPWFRCTGFLRVKYSHSSSGVMALMYSSNRVLMLSPMFIREMGPDSPHIQGQNHKSLFPFRPVVVSHREVLQIPGIVENSIWNRNTCQWIIEYRQGYYKDSAKTDCCFYSRLV